MWNFDFWTYTIFKIGVYSFKVGNLISATLLIMLTLVAVALVKRIIERPKFVQNNLDYKRQHSVFMIVKYFIWVISFLLLLEVLDFKVTLILAGSAALLVGIGLGLQNIFADFISGFFLLFEGTIKIGDIIEVDDVVGKVTEINLRSSEVLTRDGVTFIIPNSKFVVEKVTNWSRNTENVRFMVDIGVAYGSDIDQVMEVLKKCLNENKYVEKNPSSFIRFKNFGDSSLDFQLIFWTKEVFLVENVKSNLRIGIYRALQKNGITIPFPQRDVHIKEGK
jgi:small-conductance mechanosensitive channel